VVLERWLGHGERSRLRSRAAAVGNLQQVEATDPARPSTCLVCTGKRRLALPSRTVEKDAGRTAHGMLRLRRAHGGDGVPVPTAVAREHGVLQMTGRSRDRRSLPPRRRDTPMTGSDDPDAGGSGSCLRCPRCGLSIRPRASWLTIEHCPRCIARDRTPVKLLSYPPPAVEHYRQGFGSNARGATTEQAPFPEDEEAAS
jgi:hypothetical protein